MQPPSLQSNNSANAITPTNKPQPEPESAEELPIFESYPPGVTNHTQFERWVRKHHMVYRTVNSAMSLDDFNARWQWWVKYAKRPPAEGFTRTSWEQVLTAMEWKPIDWDQAPNTSTVFHDGGPDGVDPLDSSRPDPRVPPDFVWVDVPDKDDEQQMPPADVPPAQVQPPPVESRPDVLAPSAGNAKRASSEDSAEERSSPERVARKRPRRE